MSEEKKVDLWAVITLVIILICLAASFWATNTATQTRFDMLQLEVRNLNTATHNEIRMLQRDVIQTREFARQSPCGCQRQSEAP
jgi:hypothetical protein